MPNALSPIQRQSGLRQLRMNLLPSIFIWGGVGIGWGLKMAYEGNGLGIVLLIAALVFGWIFARLNINRMRSNEWREVREVLTAFLAGYRTGAFKEKTKS